MILVNASRSALAPLASGSAVSVDSMSLSQGAVGHESAQRDSVLGRLITLHLLRLSAQAPTLRETHLRPCW